MFKKHGRKIRVVLVVILLAGIGIGAFMLLNKEVTKPSDDRTPEDRIQFEAAEKARAKTASFEEINKAFVDKDYEKTISLAIGYANDEANSKTERLNATLLCILAAVEVKNDGSREECKKIGDAVAATLDTEEQKQLWLAQLANAATGVKPEQKNGFSDGELR